MRSSRSTRSARLKRGPVVVIHDEHTVTDTTVADSGGIGGIGSPVTNVLLADTGDALLADTGNKILIQ